MKAGPSPDRVGPLSGYVIGVTADRRSGEQIELLVRKGASVIHGPTIRTHPLGAESDLADATRDVIERPPDITLLSTGIGVRGWFEAAESLDLGEALLDSLCRGQIFARGKKAHGAAVTAGLALGWQTPNGTSAELVDELARRGAGGLRIAVQLDGADGAPLADAVRRLGAEVVPVPVYRWTMPDDAVPAHRLLTAIVDRRVDAVTFTARPQIENLVELADAAGKHDDLVGAFRADVVPVCVGPVCGVAATDAGFAPPLVPDRYRLGSMVLQLASAFGDRGMDVRLGDVEVRIQGTVVVVAGELIQLSDREADLLHALAARFGKVVSKPQLLERVWNGAESDEHVVEVTVARLRGRLGDAGRGLETVVRRGYRLSAA